MSREQKRASHAQVTKLAFEQQLAGRAALHLADGIKCFEDALADPDEDRVTERPKSYSELCEMVGDDPFQIFHPLVRCGNPLEQTEDHWADSTIERFMVRVGHLILDHGIATSEREMTFAFIAENGPSALLHEMAHRFEDGFEQYLANGGARS